MENNDFCTLRNKGRFKPRFYPRWATTIFKTWHPFILPFLIAHDKKNPTKIEGNSSVFRFEIGQYPQILSHFEKTRENIYFDNIFLYFHFFTDTQFVHFEHNFNSNPFMIRPLIQR
jgi:hypothetical protein